MKLIKIPFAGGGLGKAESAEKGPDKIVEQMHDLFLNESGVNPGFEIEEVKVNNSNIDETNKAIFEKVLSLKEKAIILGGDHSITYSCFRAFCQNNPGAGLVIFDAHPDLEAGLDTPTQEDYTRLLIKEGILDAKKLILIGTRNWHGYEKEFALQNNIKSFDMKQIFKIGVDDVCDNIMEQINKWPAVYISIDIDVVDPAFAPGTGYREPGGLSSRELLHMLQRIKLLKNIRMIDLVEIAPDRDIADLTSKLGAKIVKEMGQ
ncbi:arginase family protein [Candidatus Woesearchaeota archaeon]|nr:arginase family protein [Candidatus Woesearchaeota archaeon]